MRTGRALTVSGEGGVGASQKKFWGKKIEKKKKKKFWRPPEKLETPRTRTPPPCGQTHACENITLAQLRCGR